LKHARSVSIFFAVWCLPRDSLQKRHFAARNVRTLILILICTAFVAGAILDAKAEQKGSAHVLKGAAIAFVLGIVFCWMLVHVIGIFDGWKRS
jgi:hypothetical protein